MRTYVHTALVKIRLNNVKPELLPYEEASENPLGIEILCE